MHGLNDGGSSSIACLLTLATVPLSYRRFHEDSGNDVLERLVMQKKEKEEEKEKKTH